MELETGAAALQAPQALWEALSAPIPATQGTAQALRRWASTSERSFCVSPEKTLVQHQLVLAAPKPQHPREWCWQAPGRQQSPTPLCTQDGDPSSLCTRQGHSPAALAQPVPREARWPAAGMSPRAGSQKGAELQTQARLWSPSALAEASFQLFSSAQDAQSADCSLPRGKRRPLSGSAPCQPRREQSMAPSPALPTLARLGSTQELLDCLATLRAWTQCWRPPPPPGHTSPHFGSVRMSMMHFLWGPTVVQFLARVTMAPASSRP